MNGTSAAPLGMKWHKFLIYFSLWLSALVGAANAISYFTGAYYGGDADYVYSVFPSMSIIDKVVALACVAAAVMAIVTRFSLARYEAKGPGLLTGLYVLNLVISVGYLALVVVTTGLSLSELTDSSTVSSLVTSIAMIFINKSYYAKRGHLFVN